MGNPFRYWADQLEWEGYVRSTFLESAQVLEEASNESVHEFAYRDPPTEMEATLRVWRNAELTEVELPRKKFSLVLY